jgi:predicted extracellular nuclease
MLRGILKTPLFAAFFCAVILAACNSNRSTDKTNTLKCSSPATPISGVQGASTVSPILGQEVTVSGIVTLIQGNQGFYIEEPYSDTDYLSSNAIFIQFSEMSNGLETGSLVSSRGTVSEIGAGRQSLTALTDVTALIVCASDRALPLTDIKLPLTGPEREALEGMRVQVNGPIVATDVFQFGRRKFTLSGNGLQYVPTEVEKPGPDTVKLLALNRAFALPAMLQESVESPRELVSGTSLEQITGVFAHDDRGLRVSLESMTGYSSPDYEPPAVADADVLRIVSMNLHNYFNGDGMGSGFPTDRGAETAADFEQQRQRIGAAIGVLEPHVLGVMELENDGFGGNSAAQDLIHLANLSTRQNWGVARPVDDNMGNHVITVGLLYRTDRLEPIGPARTLIGPEFELSRPPLAQLFQIKPGGATILIVINHLKSKGSCPESGADSDQKDGQACWNHTRRVSAEKMAAWVKKIAAFAETGNVLILGDMNAYRLEDPIVTMRRAGFTELMDTQLGFTTQSKPYSFAWYGQHGTLDYAFSSDALLGRVRQAFIWNVNAAQPANMELPEPWLRFSDHDPVVVDIR